MLAKFPEADVSAFESNLARVTDPERRRAALLFGTEHGVEDLPVPERLLNEAEFARADARSPRHADWWAFPVCSVTEDLSGNERAIFEHVKDDPSIRKIVLTRSKDIALAGANVTLVPLESPAGQHALMRSGVILVRNDVANDIGHPVSAKFHNIVRLPKQEMIERTGYTSNEYTGRVARVEAEQAQCAAAVASSRTGVLAMAASLFPLCVGQIWNTGQPRSDFILAEEETLPEDLASELERLRGLLGDRRLVLFMPTPRDDHAQGTYRFEDSEIDALGRWLSQNNCVLGIREAEAPASATYRDQLAGLSPLDLSERQFTHTEILYRVADVLVTDYSSVFIDFMLTGRPAVGFAFDRERYEGAHGFLVDLDLAFPGPVVEDFEALLLALDASLDGDVDPDYDLKRRLFHDQVDAQNSARVVERIRDLGDLYGIGTWEGRRVA